MTYPTPILPKLLTGITGFDRLSGGGIPLGRATLVIGGPGAGKTVFAMQTLVNNSRQHQRPGIFVAFEETPRNVIADLKHDLKRQEAELKLLTVRHSVQLESRLESEKHLRT